MPVYNWLDKFNYEDKISGHSCHYSYAENLKRFEKSDDSEWADAHVFPNWMYLVENMKANYALEFNLNKALEKYMTFLDAYGYSDAIIAKSFEGIPLKVPFYNDEKWLWMNMTQ